MPNPEYAHCTNCNLYMTKVCKAHQPEFADDYPAPTLCVWWKQMHAERFVPALPPVYKTLARSYYTGEIMKTYDGEYKVETWHRSHDMKKFSTEFAHMQGVSSYGECKYCQCSSIDPTTYYKSVEKKFMWTYRCCRVEYVKDPGNFSVHKITPEEYTNYNHIPENF